MSVRPVLIAAGGTGGHVIPALAVAEALRSRRVPVLWAGTAQGLESRLVPQSGIAMTLIDIRGLRGQNLFDTLLGPLRIVHAVFQSLRLLRRERVCAVLGMGGFVSGPVAIAALLLRVPLVLHEQNAVAGMTNSWLARSAARVFSAFPGVFPGARRAEVVGNPVPQAIVVDEPARCESQMGPLRVLVIGGSRGAEFLNQIVPQAVAHCQPGTVSVRHQAGAGRADATRARYDAKSDVEVTDFVDDMASAYRTADLVISRAGAMTVTELAASATPAVLVPFPHAVDDHQTANARWLVDAGAAILLPQAELVAERLAGVINELASDRDALTTMASAARQRFVPGAAERVANALVEVSGQVVDTENSASENKSVEDMSVDRRQPVRGSLC